MMSPLGTRHFSFTSTETSFLLLKVAALHKEKFLPCRLTKKFCMKNFLLLSFFVAALFAGAIAQPTITSTWLPTVGMTFHSQNIDTSGINEGNAGANQTWNFSNAVASGAQLSIPYILPSSTPYAATYPSATLASGSNANGYNFYTTSSTDWSLIGLESAGASIQFSNPMKFFQFPCTYNTTFTDQVAGSGTSGGYAITRSGTHTLTADGYGTITTPAGTFPNALRFKSVQTYTDVFATGTVNSVTTSYEWVIAGHGNFIFQITHASFDYGFTTLYVNYDAYDPDVLSGVASLSPVAEDFSLFPNPAISKTNISFTLTESQPVAMFLQNISGQVVRELLNENLSAGNHEQEISLEGIAPGVYFIRMRSNGKEFFGKKLIVQ
jgi:hypothetical protein